MNFYAYASWRSRAELENADSLTSLPLDTKFEISFRAFRMRYVSLLGLKLVSLVVSSFSTSEHFLGRCYMTWHLERCCLEVPGVIDVDDVFSIRSVDRAVECE